MSSFYDLSATTLQGKKISFNEYGGKLVLIVNTASKCGFTPQYKDLEELNLRYSQKGLAILGFPCNQFGSQEPGGAEDINTVCRINYGVTFQIFEKTDVKGEKAHPVFKLLTEKLRGIFGTKSIKWNFTKFLISPEGKPVKRFAPMTNPKKIEKYIADFLK